MLAEVPQEPVEQLHLARDLRGPPLVQRGPVRRAEAVVVRLPMVGRERTPPALPAVRALGHFLDDPRVGEHPQVIARGTGALAQRLSERGGGGGPEIVKMPQDLAA